jgi:hypothetical protein
MLESFALMNSGFALARLGFLAQRQVASDSWGLSECSRVILQLLTGKISQSTR